MCTFLSAESCQVSVSFPYGFNLSQYFGPCIILWTEINFRPLSAWLIYSFPFPFHHFVFKYMGTIKILLVYSVISKYLIFANLMLMIDNYCSLSIILLLPRCLMANSMFPFPVDVIVCSFWALPTLSCWPLLGICNCNFLSNSDVQSQPQQVNSSVTLVLFPHQCANHRHFPQVSPDWLQIYLLRMAPFIMN